LIEVLSNFIPLHAEPYLAMLMSTQFQVKVRFAVGLSRSLLAEASIAVRPDLPFCSIPPAMTAYIPDGLTKTVADATAGNGDHGVETFTVTW
jgi:hypothetical protein